MPVPRSRSEGPLKQQFDVHDAFDRLRVAVGQLPKAAMFDLRDQGFKSPFLLLVGSLISARTRDETTVRVCLRLFEAANTPEMMISLGERRLARLLHGATFPEPKARDLIAICERLTKDFSGEVPANFETLQTFRGVGPKIAALTLSLGYGIPMIAVDVHVHRVTNRWGYVRTRTPEQTMLALESKLPKRYWIEINERLVPFGKAVCTGTAPPRCSTCLLQSICERVGVKVSR